MQDQFGFPFKSILTQIPGPAPFGVADQSSDPFRGDQVIVANTDMSGVFFYRSLKIAANVTITVPAQKRNLIIFAEDSITLEGVINAQGAGGSASSDGTDQPGAGGGGGGGAALGYGGEAGGAGGGAALFHGVVIRGGGGGGGSSGAGGAASPLTVNEALRLFVSKTALGAAGSGAGGGGGAGTVGGGAGGANGVAGGSVFLISRRVVLGSSAQIITAGTNGAGGGGGGYGPGYGIAGGGGGGGGGGSAGHVFILAQSFTNAGALFSVAGGTGGPGGPGGASDFWGPGLSGGPGGGGTAGFKQIMLLGSKAS